MRRLELRRGRSKVLGALAMAALLAVSSAAHARMPRLQGVQAGEACG